MKICFVRTTDSPSVLRDMACLQRISEVVDLKWHGMRHAVLLFRRVRSCDLVWIYGAAGEHALLSVIFSKILRKISVIQIFGSEVSKNPASGKKVSLQVLVSEILGKQCRY